jgi:hypothetical protein
MIWQSVHNLQLVVGILELAILSLVQRSYSYQTQTIDRERIQMGIGEFINN